MKLPERDPRALLKTYVARAIIDLEAVHNVRILRVEVERGEQGNIVDVRIETEEAKENGA